MRRFVVTLAILLSSVSMWAQTIPAYYHEAEYVEQKIEQIANNIEEAKDGVTFAYITDGHWRDNGKQSFPLIHYLGTHVRIPFTVYGGDNIFAFGTKESAIEEADYYVRAMQCYAPIYGVKGNHDITIRNGWHDEGGYTASAEEIYDYTVRPIAQQVKGVEGKCYYYWDDNTQDVRYIVLDLFENVNTSISWGVNYGVSQQQVDWLVKRALKCKGKTLVIFTHASIDPKLGGVKEVAFLHELFIAMQNGERFVHNEGVKVDADFRKSRNTVACIVSGHAHRDDSNFERGVLSISTICDAAYNDDPKFKELPRQRGTINEQAFDIMTINPALQMIKAVRIGQGKDREWSYSKEYGGEIWERTMPKFMGQDLSAFRMWVMKNIKFPPLAIEKKLSGRVLVSFVVGKDGSLNPDDIKVVQTPDNLLSDEVVRVVKASPQWEAGTINGKSTRVKYTIPIVFNL